MHSRIKQGEALFAEGKLREAEKCFLDELKSDPENKEAYNNLGVVAFQRQDIEKAVDYFSKSLGIDPFYKSAILNFCNVLGKLEQIYKALPFLEEITKRFPDDEEIKQFLLEAQNGYSDFQKPPAKDNSQRKIAFFCGPDDKFLGDIIKHFSKKYEVRRFRGQTIQEMRDLMQWSDISWFEWCDNLVIQASKLPKVCRVICRLHSFEVFTNYPQRVRWSWTDELVFVSEHVRKIFFEQNDVYVNSRVIPNGVDYSKFIMPKKKKYGKKIAYVGSINNKKNPSLLLQSFKAIKDYDPKFSFHIAGEFQELRIKFYWERMSELLNLDIQHAGQVSDMAGWLEDKDYIISTSYFESFQYALAEGIGCGLMPLIHNWQGADQLYPEDSFFITPHGAVELVKHYQKSDKHEIAVSNRKKLISTNDISVQLGMIDKLIKEYEPKIYRAIANNDLHRNRDYVKKHPRSIQLLIDEYEKGLATIIIPTYNRSSFISQCIESALSQTYQKVEVIVVDDGSTDNTREVLARYMDRIVYIPQENQGVSGALNTAIKASRGEYISWLSSDDAYLPDKIEVQVKELSSNPDIDWVYSDFYYMDKQSIITKKAGVVPYTNLNIVKELFNGNAINGCCVLFRRKVLKKTGLFDTKLGGRLGYTADGKMWHIMGYYYKFKFMHRPLVYYRWHEKNATHEVDIDKGHLNYIEHMKNWFSQVEKVEVENVLEGELMPVHTKIKKDGLNILWIGIVDPCGNAAMIAKAINDYTPHTCRVVTQRDTRGFDSDIVCQHMLWAGDDKEPVFNGVTQLADWADLLVFSAAIAPGAGDPGKLMLDTDEVKWGTINWKEYTRRKPSAAFFFGSMSARQNLDFYHRLFDDKGWPIFTGQLDLHRCWPDSIYVPTWIDLDHPRYKRNIVPREKVVITHSPTNRAVKNTAELIHAVESIKEKHPHVELDLIENVSFEDSLARKSKSNIGFDQMQLRDGYYCLSSIENSALGLVNIVHLNDFSRKKIIETTGTNRLPWYDVTSEDQLIEVLDGLIRDKGRLYEEQAETAKWIRQYWHPKNLVHFLIDELENLV
jgi:glycosyltransferase involved in cell wall biosynthesis